MFTLSAILVLMGLFLALGLCFAESASGQPRAMRVYLGTGSRHGSKGIYLAQLDLEKARLSEPELAVEAQGPGFLAMHPNGKWMYSVGQHVDSQGKKTGGVYAFAVNADTGELTTLNQQPSGGDGPCHLVVDREGRCVLVAHYSSGSISVLPIGSDGELAEPSCVIQHPGPGSGADPRRQEGPHAHSIQVHPSQPFAFAADLGLDQLRVYRYDSQAGHLQSIDEAAAPTAPGAGPRHQAFHPSLEDTLYLINELDSTVLVLRFDAGTASFEALQTITTLPEGFEGDNYPSEVAVHPSGRFLYGANRGHDSLAVFAIDSSSGLLTPVADVPIEGAYPRHFAIDPTGQVLIAAHQNSNNLAVFRIDADTGEPRFTGQHVELGAPMCVLYV